MLPGSVVNQVLKEKAAALEQQQGFAPGRKQLRDLKDLVIDELRPRAFIRSRTVRAWIDFEHGWFIVDSSSPKLAEDLGTVLRADLGDLPAVPLDTKEAPSGGDDRLAGDGFVAADVHRPGRLRAAGRQPDQGRSALRPPQPRWPGN